MRKSNDTAKSIYISVGIYNFNCCATQKLLYQIWLKKNYLVCNLWAKYLHEIISQANLKLNSRAVRAQVKENSSHTRLAKPRSAFPPRRAAVKKLQRTETAAHMLHVYWTTATIAFTFNIDVIETSRSDVCYNCDSKFLRRDREARRQ